MKWDILKEGLEALGLKETIPQEALDTYIYLLLEENKKTNLTRITDPEGIQIRHILDSLTPLLLPYFEEGSRVLDLGSGAGFPGIPLKLFRPGVDMTLMDSLSKRVRFLDGVISALDLEGTRAIHGRAEEAGREGTHREAYDLVLSRAVAPLPTLVEYCLPFVKVGGVFIAMKGEAGPEEEAQSQNAIKTLGGVLEDRLDFDLPDGSARSLVPVKKLKSTPKKYPRAGGKPRSKPL